MNKKTLNYLILMIFGIMTIIGNIVCLCGLWDNHSGNILTLAACTIILISVTIRYLGSKDSDQKR